MYQNDELLDLIAQRLKAMAEPTRMKILNLLKNREFSVGEIAEQLGLKHGTASANLNALHKAGLVSFRKDGTRALYRISSDMVFKVCHAVCETLKEEFEEKAKLTQVMPSRGK
jgi:DNA-binding transcriptional ArsR family regulator